MPVVTLWKMRLRLDRQPYAGRLDALIALAIAALFFLFPMSKTVVNVALLALMLLAIATLQIKTIWGAIRATPVMWFALALYALVLLHVPGSPADTEQILLHLRKYARFLYLVLIFLLLAGHARRQQIALNAFCAAMVVTVVLTWIEVGWPPIQIYLDASDTAIFGDHITQNIMLAFFSLVAFHKCKQASDRRLRFFWGGVVLLTVISITHLSPGRTGQVLLWMVWASYLIFSLRGRRLTVGLLGLLVAAALAYGSSETLRGRFDQAVAEAANAQVDRHSSIGHRIYNYTLTPQLIAEKPWLGHGTAAYHQEICRFLEEPQGCARFNWHPHNQFLFFAVDHGVVGAALYLAFVVSLYVVALRSTAHPHARAMLFCFASVCLIDSLINSPFFSSRESQFFAYMAGLLVSMNVGKPAPSAQSL